MRKRLFAALLLVAVVGGCEQRRIIMPSGETVWPSGGPIEVCVPGADNPLAWLHQVSIGGAPYWVVVSTYNNTVSLCPVVTP